MEPHVMLYWNPLHALLPLAQVFAGSGDILLRYVLPGILIVLSYAAVLGLEVWMIRSEERRSRRRAGTGAGRHAGLRGGSGRLERPTNPGVA